MTLEMRESAQQGDWLRVAELQRDRQADLEKFFAEPVPAKARDWVQRRVQDILSIDKEVVGLSLKARGDAQEALQHLQRGKRAKQAYQDSF